MWTSTLKIVKFMMMSGNIGEWRIIEKLIYLTVTKLEISFIVRLLSQFMHKPREIQWRAALRIFVHIKSFKEKIVI